MIPSPVGKNITISPTSGSGLQGDSVGRSHRLNADGLNTLDTAAQCILRTAKADDGQNQINVNVFRSQVNDNDVINVDVG